MLLQSSHAIFTPVHGEMIQINRDCDTLVLSSGVQLEVLVEKVDSLNIYFKYCDRSNERQQFVSIHTVDNIAEFIGPINDCKFILLKNNQGFRTKILKIDEKVIYCIPCNEQDQGLEVIERIKLSSLTKTLVNTLASPPAVSTKRSIADQCDVIVLADGTEIQAHINKIDDKKIYFHICGEQDFPERKIELQKISVYRFYDEMYPNICDELILKNGSKYDVVVDTIIDGAMFVRRCNSKDTKQKKIPIASIEKHIKSSHRIAKLQDTRYPTKENVQDTDNEKVAQFIFGILTGFFAPIIFATIVISTGFSGPILIMAVLATCSLFGLLNMAMTKRKNKQQAFAVGFGTALIGIITAFIIALIRG